MSADNSNEAWKVPPELEQPLPRPVRLSGNGITSCVLALACIVFGLVMSVRVVTAGLRRQASNEALARDVTTEGREAEATVTSLHTGLGHVVFYKFTVDNQSYGRGAFITPKHWQSLQIGSSLAIRYLPSDPTKSYPDADPPNSQNQWSTVVPMVGMILFFMLSFAAIQLSFVLPQHRLLARGRPARGVVTRCRVSQSRRGGYVVYYDFPLDDGSQQQGRGRSRSQLPEGSTLPVLYDSNRPRRNTPYPLEAVKLAAT